MKLYMYTGSFSCGGYPSTTTKAACGMYVHADMRALGCVLVWVLRVCRGLL